MDVRQHWTNNSLVLLFFLLAIVSALAIVSDNEKL